MTQPGKVTLETTKQKTLLSLFDGTGSICRPFVQAGWTVRKLDIDGGHGADIVVDIYETGTLSQSGKGQLPTL